MGVLQFLIPLALLLGGMGLAFFMWTIRTGQYEDLEGAAQRILIDDDFPLPDEPEEVVEATDKAREQKDVS